jgi:hypothetical protein
VSRKYWDTALELGVGTVLAALHQQVANILVVDDGHEAHHGLDDGSRYLPLHILVD